MPARSRSPSPAIFEENKKMNPERWQKIKSLFLDALRHPPEKRASFLDKNCDGNADIRREVEALLASDGEAKSFLKGLAVNEVAAALVYQPDELRTGQRLSHYRIVRPIGSGGMGKVYLAEDTALKRKVALKLLSSDYPDRDELLKRFEQEACSASALNHPNILTVHEIFVEEDRHFISTEYIEGVTLREKMLNAPLTLEEIQDIAVQVGAALSAAHTAGLVHRDVKPENIMIRADGLVKVLDFGLAKSISTDDDCLALLPEETVKTEVTTNPRVVLGTVNYLSPEQALGQPVDGRSDIFSLGVLMYEMVTGKLPFMGETLADSVSALLTKEFDPLANAAPNCAAKLRRVIEKAISKDPNDRYQTMKAMLTDLDAVDLRNIVTVHSSNLHSTASWPSVLEESIGEHTRSFKPLFMLTGLVLVALLGVAWFWIVGKRSAAGGVPIKSVAVLPFENRSDNSDSEYLSDGLAESVRYRLSQLSGLTVAPASSVFGYKGRNTDARKVGTDLAVEAVVAGNIDKRGDDLIVNVELVDARNGVVLWGAHYERASSDLLVVQREIVSTIADKLRLSGSAEQTLAKTFTDSNEAYNSYLKGRYFWNRLNPGDLQKAIEYYERAISSDGNYALAYAGLADVYNSALNTYPPRDVMPKAKAAALRAISIDDGLAEAHSAYGTALLHFDYDFIGAEREFKRAIELKPNYARAHQVYGSLLCAQGRFEEGIAEFQRALEIEPLSLPNNYAFGLNLHLARRYDEAESQMKKTLELEPNLLRTHYALAIIFQSQGKYAESVDAYARGSELAGQLEYAKSLRQEFAKGGMKAFFRFITDERTRICSAYTCTSYTLANYYAQLGEKDKAFIELEKAFDERNYQMYVLDVDPRFDPLRDDVRFTEMLRKVGIRE